MIDPLVHVFAKSAPDRKSRGETLTGHTSIVLSRLALWRQRLPGLAAATSRPDLWNLAAWACLLHDIGKSARGFQHMLQGGPRFIYRHEALSLVAVGWLPEEVRGWVAAGVATHHRDLPDILDDYRLGTDARTALLSELSAEDEAAWPFWLAGNAMPDLVKHGFAPLPVLTVAPKQESLAAAMRALLELRQRLESVPATSSESITARTLRGLVVLADHAGSAHEKLSDAPQLESVAAFLKAAEKTLSRGPAYHQRACSETDGHAILVAPTGSGKTEASFLWAARQQEQSAGRPVIFYVLPYRASLNAMRSRVEAKYGVPSGSVVLQHAGATTALYEALLRNKDYTREKATQVAKREHNLARLMTAPLRILTPYQLLRGFFGLRGHEAVLTDAAGGLFILDELHAYDVDRLGLILAALKHLVRDLGGRVLAMSATFPSVLREALKKVLGDGISEIFADQETQDRSRRHVLRMVDRDLLSEETITDAVHRYQSSEAVLLVATTVRRAQDLYDALKERVGEHVYLLHSRFTGEDRAAKELHLNEAVGTGKRAEGAPGTILVATQVVEVSLDVDFDVLFTDPAPVEALLQRFGRVNRGMRGPLRDVVVHRAIPSAAEKIYGKDTVARALEVLGPAADRTIDERDVQGWVDAAYEPIAPAWRAALATAMANATNNVVRVNVPLESHDELRERFDKLFDGCEVIPESKLGEFVRCQEEEPLRAASLRVPISHGQLGMLYGKKRIRWQDGNAIAIVPYDSTRGLELGFRDEQP